MTIEETRINAFVDDIEILLRRYANEREAE